MDQVSKFWDRLADKYARQPIADEQSYQTKLRVTRELLRPEMRLFEFGCGTGGTAAIHAPHVEHIRAVEVSERMLEIARENAKAAGVENITFERGDITTMEFGDERYDMVLGLSILHLMKDPAAVIEKVYSLLAPGGYFVTSTACLGDNMGFFRYIGPVGRFFGLLPIINVMKADELVQTFKDTGFEIVHRWQPGKNKALFLIGKKPD